MAGFEIVLESRPGMALTATLGQQVGLTWIQARGEGTLNHIPSRTGSGIKATATNIFSFFRNQHYQTTHDVTTDGPKGMVVTGHIAPSAH